MAMAMMTEEELKMIGNPEAMRCDAEMGIIFFSAANNRLAYFAKDPSVDDVIARYLPHRDRLQGQENPSLDFNGPERSSKKHDEELIISKMDDKELQNLPIEQLYQMEETMQKYVHLIKAKRKEQCDKKIAELEHTLKLLEAQDQVGVDDVCNQNKNST